MILVPDLTLATIRDVLDRIEAELFEHVDVGFDSKVTKYRVLPDTAHEALFELRWALDRELLRQAERVRETTSAANQPVDKRAT
jgi:hypothetical protein